MGTFIITGPDGKKYKVTGPGTKEDALAQVQRQLGAQPPAAQKGPGEDLLYKIPGVGPYLQSADEAVQSVIGRPPNAQEGIQGLQDIARIGVGAVSLGGADYLAGGNQAELTRQAAERIGPGATALVDFTAGSLTPTGVPRIQQGGRVISAIGHGISGGAQNVISEWTRGERDIKDLAKAGLVGSGLSAGVSAIADPIASYFSKRAAAKALPETKSLKEEGRAGYEEVKKAGGVYHSSDARQLLATITNMKLSPGLDDRAIALRKSLLKNWKGKDISPDQLDKLRRIVREKMATGKLTDRTLGEEFIKGMDKFAKTTPVTSATGAEIPGVNETLEAARQRYQQYYKAREIDKAAPREKGLLNVYGESSDAPALKRLEKIDERIQSRGGQGFTGSEQQALKRAADGSFLRDAGEWARKGRIPAGVSTGISFLTAGVGGWPAALAPLALEGVSKLGRNATKADFDELQSIIKTGKGLTADSAQVAALKDKLARMMSAATRTGYDQFGGPR